MPEQRPTVDEQTLLQGLLTELQEAQSRGEDLNLEQLIQDHPQFAEQLRSFVQDQYHAETVDTPCVRGAPFEATGGWDAPTEIVTPLRTVGKYEILDEIARGGMGVVYRAAQRVMEGQPVRRVAVKMISQASAPDSEATRRFHLEAAAVAQLDHPHIIPLYDSGEDQGRPWFAMKLIEGGSLAQHRNEFRGRFRTIAELMLAITRAIEHAHQRGILHRDLKPGNVLLDDQGQPMVTDFGLAKTVVSSQEAPHQEGESHSLTQTGALMGTPSYLAPEQARGSKNITTATDLYGLGGILYELLTGNPPFRGSTPMSTILDVLEKDPIAPSSIDPDCNRDLETICLKCLEKEPHRRYGSATVLAEELERYLNDEPLLTRPLGPIQRWVKWYRRQPLIAGLSSAVMVLLVVGISLILWQWNRAETQKVEAERKSVEANQQRKKAEAAAEKALRERQLAHRVVMEFCLELSRQHLANVEGLQPLQKKLLEAGLTYLKGFLVENQNDIRLRRDVADALFSLGILTSVVGSKVRAQEVYGEAREVYRELAERNPGEAHFRDRIAGCSLNLSNLKKELGDYQGAEKDILLAQSTWRKLIEGGSASQEWRRGLASTYTSLAGLRDIRGHTKQALDLHMQARALYQSLVDIDETDWDAISGLAIAQHNIGLQFLSSGKAREGLRELKLSLKWKQKVADARPKDLWIKSRLATTHTSLADAYKELKETEKVFAEYDLALKILRPLVDANPEVSDFRNALAGLLQNQGNAFKAAEKPQKALGAYQEGLKHLHRLVRDNPESHQFRFPLGQIYHNLGNLLRDHSEIDQAIDCFSRAIVHFDKLVKASPERWSYHKYVAGTSANLGDVLQKAGRHQDAIAQFEIALESQKIIHKHRPNSKAELRSVSRFYGNLARAHRIANQPNRPCQLRCSVGRYARMTRTSYWMS